MKRILLVDDDDDMLECLQVILEEHYEVSTARNGQEAVAQAVVGPWDLLVLDLAMPVMSGAGVLEELRRRNLDVPVILASAALDLHDKARELGVADFIAKPYDFALLEKKIHSVLSSRHG